MEFTVDETRWEASVNRLPSRHISVEKHAAINKMVDDLLDLEVIHRLEPQRGRMFTWLEIHPTVGDLRWIFVILTRSFQTRDGKSQI